MAKTDFESVDDYIASQPQAVQGLLDRVRSAIRAGRGELGIIPGSMGAKSYVVRGLGNASSFESASHGAGRRMSRTEARRRFSVADLRDQTEGSSAGSTTASSTKRRRRTRTSIG